MVADQELKTVLVPDDPTGLALSESVLCKAIYFGLKALSFRREVPGSSPLWRLGVGVLGLLLCLTSRGSSFFQGFLLLG